MRISGGTLKGRALQSPPGLASRPTTDKVRQSIFNILMNDIEGKTVLDLFAGSGALGIEALSRGAKAAAFVEIAHPPATVIRMNLKNLDLSCPVLEMDYKQGCHKLSERGGKFDLIFADPPYDKITPRDIIETILGYSLLAPEGFLIIEHRFGAEKVSERMTIIKSRKFGQTEVTFYAAKKGEKK